MPKLIFNTIKPKVTFYIRFDIATGVCNGISTVKKGNCIEVEEELAQKLSKGQLLMSNYKVIFDQNSYKLVEKSFATKDDNTQNYCKNLYRIIQNNEDGCIRFALDMSKKEWFVTMDQTLRKHLKKTMTFENWLYDFFVVDKDNFNNLYYMFKLDLLKLILDGHLRINHSTDQIPALLCRKIFNYSLEVKHGY